MIFAPLVVGLSVLACGGSGTTADKPVGAGNQSSTGATGGSGGSSASGAGGTRASGGRSGGTGEAGEGSGASASGGRGGSGAEASGGSSQASGGLGSEAGAGSEGNEAGAPSAPLGPERCSDGFDNDRDGFADCSDDDCNGACATVCGGVERVADPSTLPGSNVGHAAMVASDCGATASGPAVVYSLVAETTGILEASASGSGLFRVAIRSACASADSLSCGLARASAPVTAGEELFVVVQGLEPSDQGSFTLNVLSRAIGVCGDGYRDVPESCDDENETSGDGCSAVCAVESRETEDNGTLAAADDYRDPHFAEIAPQGDVDSAGFDLATRASVVVSTENIGDGSCTLGTLDSLVELFDGNGDSLGIDDDGGEGFCARLVLPNLPAGHYTAQVSASPAGDTPTFPYRLLVFTDICGNGKKTLAEECDDGNVTNGDGCSATCQVE